jgi:hypothetical protein
MDFDDTFEFNGRSYSVLLSFDNVLLLLELLEDQAFSQFDKIEIALELLLIEYDQIKSISLETKLDLFKFIMKEFLDIDLSQPAEETPAAENGEAAEEPQTKHYCFKQDAGIIYASFFRAYQIDLFEVRGKLHWKKFLQLLLHLDDKSKFKEIVNIRTMKLPKPDKYNAEYRKEIQRMKRIYALKDDRPEAMQIDDLNKQLDSFAARLKKL